jgi:hypothetical protein
MFIKTKADNTIDDLQRKNGKQKVAHILQKGSGTIVGFA